MIVINCTLPDNHKCCAGYVRGGGGDISAISPISQICREIRLF